MMLNNNYEILTLKEKERWLHYIFAFPQEEQDIFMMPDYYELYENDKIKAECFVFHENDGIILYPYLKTNINYIVNSEIGGQYYDVEGAYGYNGIITRNTNTTLIENFGLSFKKYCRKENIIAEFVRFNPIIANYYKESYLDIELVNKVIIVDLNLDLEDLWFKSYEHAARKNIQKAKKNGVFIEFLWGHECTQHWIDRFIEIYHNTLDRREAELLYYFDRQFFLCLCDKLPNNALFVFAINDGKAISCELVLLQGCTAYSFLGGTIYNYFPVRPNNLLKHEVIIKLKKLGLTQYCLGGGFEIEDNIYRYKKTFAKNNTVDFYIGKYVHNQMIYDKVCNLWAERHPEKNAKYQRYFLKYKQ